MKMNLHRMRKAAGLTQGRLAELIGVDIKTVGNWEREVTCPDAEQIWDCAVALGCTPNDILGWYDDHPREQTHQDPYERELVTCYRDSNAEQKGVILMSARNAAGMSKETAKRDTPAADLKAV